ncbi:MAG: response regulator [Opitutaceae bacterium]|jgi:CheY-like chemotaxis protein
MAHILLIEDHDALRDMLCAALTERGHEVVGACDGQEGLKCYGEGSFDVVVTDMIMPRRDGVETIIALRRLNAGAHIIAISGGGNLVPAENCLEIATKIGASQVLQKPFTVRALAACIASELTAG